MAAERVRHTGRPLTLTLTPTLALTPTLTPNPNPSPKPNPNPDPNPNRRSWPRVSVPRSTPHRSRGCMPHGALEPQTSRFQAGLLLTRLGLALDRLYDYAKERAARKEDPDSKAPLEP